MVCRNGRTVEPVLRYTENPAAVLGEPGLRHQPAVLRVKDLFAGFLALGVELFLAAKVDLLTGFDRLFYIRHRLLRIKCRVSFLFVAKQVIDDTRQLRFGFSKRIDQSLSTEGTANTAENSANNRTDRAADRTCQNQANGANCGCSRFTASPSEGKPRGKTGHGAGGSRCIAGLCQLFSFGR